MASEIPSTPKVDADDEMLIHLALPKGHMQVEVCRLLEDAGVRMTLGNARGYRPSIPLPNYDVKLLKPQNILGMLLAGTRDIGFAGGDWVEELSITGLVEVLDTGLDPVRIVAASPDPNILTKGVGLGGRKLIVATEYCGLTQKWLAEMKIDATVLRSYGATESLPPEDADLIVDNAATGSTLKVRDRARLATSLCFAAAARADLPARTHTHTCFSASTCLLPNCAQANNLEIMATLMKSTTRLYASAAAWAQPAKRVRIERLAMLLKAVLEARKRLMVTFNIPKDGLETILEALPACVDPLTALLHSLDEEIASILRHTHPPPHSLSNRRMRAPTVSPLHHNLGYSIQIAAPTSDVPTLIPKIKAAGGTDIVVSTIRMLVV